MAKLNPLAEQKARGAGEETVLKEAEHIDGGQGTGREEMRQTRLLTFDMNDMQDLEGLQDDLEEDLTLLEFVKLAEEDPKLLYKIMDGNSIQQRDQ
jgi:hypothetical protein